MNLRISEEFGSYYHRLPLRTSPNIVYGPGKGNALRIDWSTVVDPKDLSFILGNPPFVGKKEQTLSQKADVMRTFTSVKGAGVLDYVACWYRKAADYMAGNPAIRAAFVSTNSITQGEQVGILWKDLQSRGVRIHFAHRTFQWSSEARGKAAVHCVIIGFALHDVAEKRLFDYETPQAEPHVIAVGRINPYLVDGPEIVLTSRQHPLSPIPEVTYGSFALDDGNYTLSADDCATILSECPEAEKYIRPFVGGQELIRGEQRWCLWLRDASPIDVLKMAPIRRRVEAVRAWRQKSGRETTRQLSATPALFAEIRQPDGPYLAFPTLSSERRPYIPIAFLSPETVASNQVYVVAQAERYHFGILTSTMHMAWVRAVCGRLESRYRYSAGIVYNNFPWPEATGKQYTAVEEAAQDVLDARAKFPGSTFADLYDPLAMPLDLGEAHRLLDRAVDAAYGKSSFGSEAERVAFLFERYEALIRPLLPPTRVGGKRRGSGGPKRPSTRT